LHLILGFVIALLLFWLVRYQLRNQSAKNKQWWLSISLGLAAVIFTLLALTGRLNFLVAAGAALVLFIRKIIGLLQYGPLLKQLVEFLRGDLLANDDEGESSVATSLLAMTLNHQTGVMDGQILAGSWQGHKLSQLAPNELMRLYRECRADYPDSMAVLEAYLDRTLGDGWREQAAREGVQPRSPDEMTHDEALAILGLESGASEEEIITAHRRMMQKVHPDRGGSHFLAAQVNRAKEILLNTV